MTPSIPSAFGLTLIIQISRSSGQCFYPNGDRSDGDLPCDPDAETSACCAAGFGNTCLSNKLCRGSDGNIIRGSCTDKSWESPDCPLFCLTADSGGTDLISCSNVTDSDTSYCCDHMPNCCNSGIGRFNVRPSSPDVWANYGRDAKEFSVVGTMFEDEATTTASQQSTTSFEDQGSTTNASTTEMSETLAATDPARSSSNDENQLSTGAMSGIGVGSAAGVVLLVVVGFLLWELKRQKKSSQPEPHQSTYEWSQPTNHGTVGAKDGMQEQSGHVHSNQEWGFGASELPDESVMGQSRPYELGGRTWQA